jgi:hypothetical protein
MSISAEQSSVFLDPYTLSEEGQPCESLSPENDAANLAFAPTEMLDPSHDFNRCDGLDRQPPNRHNEQRIL